MIARPEDEHQNERLAAMNWPAYQEVINEVTDGPEYEGVYENEYNRICDVGNGVTVDVLHQGRTLRLPLLSSIVLCDGVNQDYFKERFSDGYSNHAFLLSPSVLKVVEKYGLKDPESLTKKIDQLIKEPTTVLVSHEINDIDSQKKIANLFSSLSVAPVELPVLDEKNGTEASVIHYSGIPQFTEPLSGKYAHLTIQEVYRNEQNKTGQELRPENGTSILLPEVIDDKFLDEIWDMYDRQIAVLIENHPMYQRLTREELTPMLTDPTSVNTVHFVDGKPICLFIGVTNFDAHTPWLRKDYLKQTYGEAEELLYCPALVVDFEHSGMNYSKNIFECLTNMVQLRGKNMRAYFECTNISAEYVPEHVFEAGVNSTGICTIKAEEQARYIQKLFKF